MIEIILPVWRRRKRIPGLLEQFRNQTVQNFNVNIWNNSGERIDTGDFPKERILVVDSKENKSPGDRFKLLKYIKGSPIISLDDDESIEKDFVEYYYKQYKKWGPNCVLGWYTKTFYRDTEKNFRRDRCMGKEDRLSYGSEVDYIGGGGMVLSRKIFKEYPLLLGNKRYYDELQADSLYLGYVARKLGYRLIAIEPKCEIIYDGQDAHHHVRPLKKQAFLELRGKGWRFLDDV